MATIKFLYRSRKQNEPITVKLNFSHNGKQYRLFAKSEITVYTKDEIKDNFKLNAAKIFDKLIKGELKDRFHENIKPRLDSEIADLKYYILDEFNNTNIERVAKNKDWLKNIVDKYYKPSDENDTKQLSTNLVDYFDVYIKSKKGDIKESSIKKYKVIQSKLKRLEDHFKTTLKIENINENFKNQFNEFCDLNQYSNNTKQRELVLIKTVCFHARYNGLKTHKQLDKLKFNREDVEHPYLSFDELETIKNKHFDKDYLDNARDWLIISCFTGQRVSDFMKFTSKNIRIEDNKKYLEFKQQKTSNLTTIPVLKQVNEVLNKRGGKFPRPISDQKYNDYIKEVCRLCEIDEVMTGKKRICIAPDGVKPEKHHYRDVVTSAPKYEFISSHIGRRSFATNHYGKVPTTYLIGITNHSTEAQFLNYIQKGSKDLAKDAHNYFE